MRGQRVFQSHGPFDGSKGGPIVKLILGTMTFGESVFAPDVSAFLSAFLDAGYEELDTAYELQIRNGLYIWYLDALQKDLESRSE